MVRKIWLEHFENAEKKGYNALMFDCDFSVKRLFVEPLTLLTMFDISERELCSLKVGDKIYLNYKGD